LAAEGFGVSGNDVRNAAELISPILSVYLDDECFSETWERISRVKRTKDSFLAAFHEWFDALKTMKLIHAFSAETFPRCGVEDAVPPLLEMAGLVVVAGVKSQLDLLRKVQNSGL
jgi:hypothetical protein